MPEPSIPEPGAESNADALHSIIHAYTHRHMCVCMFMYRDICVYVYVCIYIKVCVSIYIYGGLNNATGVSGGVCFDPESTSSDPKSCSQDPYIHPSIKPLEQLPMH